MKLLIVSNLFRPHILGGYELLCGQVCDELARRGHDVRVLTTGDPNSPTRASDGMLTEVARLLELSRPFDLLPRRDRVRRWFVGRANHRNTRDYVARHRPDVIFLWSQLRLTVGPALAAEQSSTPVAYTLNDENISSYLPASGCDTLQARIGRALDRWVVPSITLSGLQFHHATCISHLLKRNLIASGLPLEHARVIHQGIPLERFPLKQSPGKLSLPLRVLYVGQLHPYKGVHTLIESAHQVASTFGRDRIRVTIVGGGAPAYVAELATLGANLPGSVRLVGRKSHEDPPSIYRDHDVLVFPSLWQEPFGLTHLEAMASGTPVVSTADGGQGEFLVDRENALVFDKGSVRGLSGCLATLMSSPELAQDLAHNARAMVENQFTVQRYTTALEQFLVGASGLSWPHSTAA